MSKFYFYLILVFMLSSCAQLSVFHSARTEGKGNLSITPVLEGTGISSGNRGGGDIGNAAIPGFRLELSYGLTDKLDIVASGSSAASLLTSIKYRIYGSNESPFSLSVMPGYEYQSSLNDGSATISRFHIPVIATFYTNDNFGFSVGPKYVLQVDANNDNYSFPGIFAGINIDRKVKYTIGGGAFLPFNTLSGSEGLIFQLGVSAKIPLYSNN